MKHDNHIGNLITKFNTGNISHEELAVLVTYFKENKPDSELMEVYNKAWQDAANADYQVSTAKTYQELLKKIKTGTGEARTFTISGLLKYAAVFVVAFSIAWFLSRLSKDNNTDIAYQNIEVPYGSKTKIELPDGSKITLNSGSKLRYAKSFGDKERTVFLEGEAFFDVVKNHDNPFFVNASGIRVKVLGTTFNVKAYPEEKTIETTLITGKVEIYKSDNKNASNPIATLTPNQKAVFNKNLQEIKEEEKIKELKEEQKTLTTKSIQIQKDVNVQLSTAWKDNQFVFDNESFGEVIKKIERWYNVEIELNHPDLMNARISGKFDKETIEQAMKALTFITPFQFRLDKNMIEIYK